MYYGVNVQVLNRLQSVQNAAVRLVKSKDTFRNVPTDEYLKQFHRLPVKLRIIFKMMLIIHKCLTGNAPNALSTLLNYSSSTRTLKLNHKRSKSTYGDRAFSVSGPKIWNLLPSDIRVVKDVEKFKGLLKTFLFNGTEQFLRKIREQ